MEGEGGMRYFFIILILFSFQGCDRPDASFPNTYEGKRQQLEEWGYASKTETFIVRSMDKLAERVKKLEEGK